MTKTWKEITSSRPDTAERQAAYEVGRQEALGQIVAFNLAELRKLRVVTQVELARHLGVTQPSLSGLEHRNDVQLSTLRDYIEALGGKLEIRAVFDDIKVPIALAEPSTSHPGHKTGDFEVLMDEGLVPFCTDFWEGNMVTTYAKWEIAHNDIPAHSSINKATAVVWPAAQRFLRNETYALPVTYAQCPTTATDAEKGNLPGSVS